MSSNATKCLHCDKTIYYNRMISHLMNNHKEEFKAKNKLSIKRCNREKSALLDVVLVGGMSHKCCLGCNKVFNRDKYITQHNIEHKDCKKKHLETVETLIDTNEKEETVIDNSEEIMNLKKLLAEANKKNEKLQTKCNNLDSRNEEVERFRNVLIGVCKTLQDNGENIMEYLTPIITEKNEMYGEDHTHVIDDVLQEIE